MDGGIGGVVDHGESFFVEVGVDVEHAVEVAAFGSADVDDVGVEDLAVGFIKVDPFFDECFGLFGVVEAGSAVTGDDSGAEVLGEVGFVGVEVFAEWFEGGSGAAAVVLDEGEHHPSHGGSFFPGAVVDVLAGDEDLELSG